MYSTFHEEIGLAETKARMMYMAEVYNNDKVKANFKYSHR